MYRNREGNKILLDLLDRYEKTSLRDKIINYLPVGECSKFCHERWNRHKGVSSGPVGIDSKSFSEADSINRKGRKKNLH